MLAEKLYNNKIRNVKQNWNFGPNLGSCKSVKYVANHFAKSLKLKIKLIRANNRTFKLETSFLRLSNFKSKKFLKWYPKWTLEETMNRILDWNRDIKFKSPKIVCANQIRDFLKN